MDNSHIMDANHGTSSPMPSEPYPKMLNLHQESNVNLIKPDNNNLTLVPLPIQGEAESKQNPFKRQM